MVTLESLIISTLIILLLLLLLFFVGGGIFVFLRWKAFKAERLEWSEKETDLTRKADKLEKERNELKERVEEVESHVFATDEDDEPLDIDVVGLKLFIHVEKLGVMGQHDNVDAILRALVFNPQTIRIVALADGRVVGWIGNYSNPPKAVNQQIRSVGELEAQPIWKGK